MPCPICSNSKKIYLPIRQIHTRALPLGVLESYTPSYKEYPCPECNKIIVREIISPHYENDSNYIEHLKSHCAQTIFNEYIESNSFEFQIITNPYSQEKYLECKFPNNKNNNSKKILIQAIQEAKSSTSNKSLTKSEVVNLINTIL